MSTRLRKWQSECLELAKSHYLLSRDLFVQATPASGKTRLAAEITRWLLEEGRIDFVICFAPTREVVAGIQRTFTVVLNQRFGDTLASVGAAYTYQSMEYHPEDFWALFTEYRTLTIFDEIHHCAGHDPLLSNTWGQQIIQRIQNAATYTLALSGTPWRSDDLPIALARYSDPEGKVICDYRYDLKSAIKDGVCRSPRITLIDNPLIRLTEESESTASVKAFSSFQQLLSESPISYEDLLRHDDILNAVLDLSIDRLNQERNSVPNAGGLVVATDIEHAHQIAELLINKGESYVVVTSQTPKAHQLIDQYRYNSTRWIVAVSMISEGTDIQRLCVCAYLSRIRTELHYRQVLGRILRKMGDSDDQAWLYVIAEPLLRKYSQRIADDLPEDQAMLQTQKLRLQLEKARSNQICRNEESRSVEHDNQSTLAKSYNENGMLSVEPPLLTLSFSEYYHHHLLSLI
ncbi:MULTISPECIES: DEAD/DEAH box helicase [unclassified Halomonas]|uniref:DEAD/DEAH box helicase n=1 Tax=Halomonas sp. IOP_14 TaxID=2873295 RepID=UPI0020A66253|nr:MULTISPECIES: DEAD/DEAH box helicase family protein [unclassified Halomonas]MCD1587375.1 DEAD/DEAH box helicase family protein [Halomonas sp. IOP_14]UTD54548.1 DEAD/DEAH box helicase family protein [Halomonas sp. MS1]